MQTVAFPSLSERFAMAWGFVVLTVLFKDIHELFRPGFIDEARSGISNDAPVSELALLYGGIGVTFLVAMVFLPRLLSLTVNRWTNGIAAILAAVMIATFPRNDLDDVWFALVQMAVLAWVLVAAVRGKG